jgi:hypothetical protein
MESALAFFKVLEIQGLSASCGAAVVYKIAAEMT